MIYDKKKNQYIPSVQELQHAVSFLPDPQSYPDSTFAFEVKPIFLVATAVYGAEGNVKHTQPSFQVIARIKTLTLDDKGYLRIWVLPPIETHR